MDSIGGGGGGELHFLQRLGRSCCCFCFHLRCLQASSLCFFSLFSSYCIPFPFFPPISPLHCLLFLYFSYPPPLSFSLRLILSLLLFTLFFSLSVFCIFILLYVLLFFYFSALFSGPFLSFLSFLYLSINFFGLLLSFYPLFSSFVSRATTSFILSFYFYFPCVLFPLCLVPYLSFSNIYIILYPILFCIFLYPLSCSFYFTVCFSLLLSSLRS